MGWGVGTGVHMWYSNHSHRLRVDSLWWVYECSLQLFQFPWVSENVHNVNGTAFKYSTEACLSSASTVSWGSTGWWDLWGLQCQPLRRGGEAALIGTRKGRTKYSPNQSQALASSPSLMEPFQYHDWLLPLFRWRLASGGPYKWPPTWRDFRAPGSSHPFFPPVPTCSWVLLLWVVSKTAIQRLYLHVSSMKAENPQLLLYC